MVWVWEANAQAWAKSALLCNSSCGNQREAKDLLGCEILPAPALNAGLVGRISPVSRETGTELPD